MRIAGWRSCTAGRPGTRSRAPHPRRSSTIPSAPGASPSQPPSQSPRRTSRPLRRFALRRTRGTCVPSTTGRSGTFGRFQKYRSRWGRTRPTRTATCSCTTMRARRRWNERPGRTTRRGRRPSPSKMGYRCARRRPRGGIWAPTARRVSSGRRKTAPPDGSCGITTRVCRVTCGSWRRRTRGRTRRRCIAKPTRRRRIRWRWSSGSPNPN